MDRAASARAFGSCKPDFSQKAYIRPTVVATRLGRQAAGRTRLDMSQGAHAATGLAVARTSRIAGPATGPHLASLADGRRGTEQHIAPAQRSGADMQGPGERQLAGPGKSTCTFSGVSVCLSRSSRLISINHESRAHSVTEARPVVPGMTRRIRVSGGTLFGIGIQ